MGLGLNLEKVQENTSIPDGTYPVILNKAEVTPTKSGGTMIKIQLKVTGETQNGRVVFDNFNIENSNPQAVQIGLGQLKGMMKAFGHRNPNMLNSVEELIGLKGLIAVKTVDDGGAYGPQTKIRSYKPEHGGAVDAQAPTVDGKTHHPKAANPFG